jgi:hypothetical protein
MKGHQSVGETFSSACVKVMALAAGFGAGFFFAAASDSATIGPHDLSQAFTGCTTRRAAALSTSPGGARYGTSRWTQKSSARPTRTSR